MARKAGVSKAEMRNNIFGSMVRAYYDLVSQDMAYDSMIITLGNPTDVLEGGGESTPISAVKKNINNSRLADIPEKKRISVNEEDFWECFMGIVYKTPHMEGVDGALVFSDDGYLIGGTHMLKFDPGHLENLMKEKGIIGSKERGSSRLVARYASRHEGTAIYSFRGSDATTDWIMTEWMKIRPSRRLSRSCLFAEYDNSGKLIRDIHLVTGRVRIYGDTGIAEDYEQAENFSGIPPFLQEFYKKPSPRNR